MVSVGELPGLRERKGYATPMKPLPPCDHDECPPTRCLALASSGCSVMRYRLVLSHPEWPRETRTKWQDSQDFTKALAKAKELGVTARVESQNTQVDQRPLQSVKATCSEVDNQG
jgi:hypothetical protein